MGSRTPILIPLIETVEDYRERFEIIKEQSDNKTNMYLKGIWGQAEIWNINSRWYQLKEMESEVERFNKEVIPKRKALGELDHSDKTNIQLHRTSHIFEDPLYMDKNNMMGKARILNTGFGNTLQVLAEEKIPFGVSTKAMGSLSKFTKNGKTGNLVSHFTLTSPGDVVFNQSAPDAIPEVITEMIAEEDKRLESIFDMEVLVKARTLIKKSTPSELKRIKSNVMKFLMDGSINTLKNK